ncbi:MAG: cupin domain-containing protein, partial [Actinobacteria bacterium]|nr:cupin domain-containing protein [Actinomycetota bacterium]
QENDDFRRVVDTRDTCLFVLMTIPRGGEMGEEVHVGVDPLLLFVEGVGVAVVVGEREPIARNQLVVVPAGTRHNFVNTGAGPLRLVTVYAPPEHAPGTVHETKDEADAAEHH